MIIFISERSTRFAQLIGRKNPVAALATLILLSYTKLLCTIILSFSFAALMYPDNSVQLVWLSDGTVKYFSDYGTYYCHCWSGIHSPSLSLAVDSLLSTKYLFKWAND